MTKKNTGKTTQMLSPENYIRQKARTLPIYECLVNSDWEDSRMVQLSIARRHTNENITAGFFLVDLLCLGVKDTHFMFNISETEYREQNRSICLGNRRIRPSRKKRQCTCCINPDHKN